MNAEIFIATFKYRTRKKCDLNKITLSFSFNQLGIMLYMYYIFLIHHYNVI